MSRAGDLADAGMALIAASLEEGRAHLSLSRSRIERLKAAQHLENLGRPEEAQRIYDEVKAEQERDAGG